MRNVQLIHARTADGGTTHQKVRIEARTSCVLSSLTAFSCDTGPVDAVDRELIACLVEDGRAGYGALGDRIGLSASAVKRRMDRLIADGVITGFTVVLDPLSLGHTTEAYVEVHCRGTISPQDLRAAFERVPEVHSAATISGQADAMLRIVARDVRDLERALERVREETAGIDHTETAIVLSRLIDRPGPGLPDLPAD